MTLISDQDGSKELYLEERRQEIVRQVNHSGRVSVAELAERFGVSEVTIRADLQALAARNLIVRTHGGAVPMGRGLRELSLADRSQQQVTEKDRIGAAGAAMVSNGDAIVLDSSSTALAIAKHLKQHRDLTILTNSLAIAHEMLEEALKMRRIPGIYFTDTPTGRHAHIAGTGLGVWEIVRVYREENNDWEALRESFDWLTEQQLRTALAYAEAYPEEIGDRIALEDEFSVEEVWKKYPFTRPPWA